MSKRHSTRGHSLENMHEMSNIPYLQVLVRLVIWILLLELKIWPCPLAMDTVHCSEDMRSQATVLGRQLHFFCWRNTFKMFLFDAFNSFAQNVSVMRRRPIKVLPVSAGGAHLAPYTPIWIGERAGKRDGEAWRIWKGRGGKAGACMKI